MSPATIVLASADPRQRQLIDLLLSQDGHALVPFGTAREALAYLRTATPDLILLTIDLPDLAGDLVCQKVKGVSRLSKVPVILVARRPERGAEARLRWHAQRVGADLLLPLPLGDKDLRGRVRRLLPKRAADVNQAARPGEGYAAPTSESPRSPARAPDPMA